MRPENDDDRLLRIVRLAVKQTGAQVGLLYLVHEDRGDLQIAATVGEGVESIVGLFVDRTGLAGFAIDDGNPLAIASQTGGSVGASPSAGQDAIDELTGLETRNLLAVPLLIHGRASGALELRNCSEPRGFTPDHIALATELAYLAAAAVEEYRGERFLFALFEAALPQALGRDRGGEVDGLAAELGRWLSELRQSSAWREQVELVAQVRELCRSGQDAVALARSILGALVERETQRRRLAEQYEGS